MRFAAPPTPRATIKIALLLIVVLSLAIDVAAATRYDWRLRFRTFRTPHFDIHAHQGEEALARRLASIAEEVRGAMQPLFGVPSRRVQVILVDQSDLSNGWATPFPYDAIEIAAAPPHPESLIGNTDEWLRLVFTHEYTHILHLDRTRGFMRVVRGIFGRSPVAFPNAFLPVWQVEGIATFEESRMTHEGRVPAGDFRVIVDAAARAGRFEPRDRASGGLDDWPGGTAPYAYGAYFHQYLVDRYGADRLVKLADATAGRVPLFGAPAFKRVYGRSIGQLWNDFRQARTEEAAGLASTNPSATRLTQHGFSVFAPRYGPDGTIYYAVSNARRFPSLNKLTASGNIQTITPRRLGERTSVRGDWIVFDQLERVRSTALFSDLYAVKTSGGSVRRLTRAARASDPDLAPDGRRIACTVQVAGRRAIGVMDFDPDRISTPEIIVNEPDGDFTGPRWSPDGSQLVVERRRRGRGYDLVIVDVSSRSVRTLVSRANVRLVTPSWMPDGRSVLFAANVGDEPFNLYESSLAGEVRKVTDVSTGAHSPEVSPDGRTLLYIGYTLDGYDLFSFPLDRSTWHVVEWSAERSAPVNESSPSVREVAYRPWRTLAPTYWSPVVETDADEFLVGAGTATTDVLGRHAYGVDAAWSSSRSRPDWRVAYAYDRWWPTLFAAYSDDTDPIREGDVRAREFSVGALLPFRRIRWQELLFAGVALEEDTIRCTSACEGIPVRQRRGSIRTGWAHDSRRIFGYSISAEEGAQVEVSLESARPTWRSDVNASAAVIEARGFQRLFGSHTVMAGRVAFAGAWGDAAIRRVFSAGGSGASDAVFDFGRDAIGLLRGFDAVDLVGTRAAVANVDLRFPLARPQRGLGSVPIFFRALHGAVFVDAGQAWDERFRAADLRTSTGGELSIDVVLAHYVPVTFSAGAAWTRDPVTGRPGGALFGRIGRAF